MFFPKKSIGIEIAGDEIKMAVVSSGRNGVRLDAYNTAPVPAHVLKVGMKEPNVLDPAAFVRILRDSYLRLLTKTNTACLSLPESTGRVMLMDVDTRFKSKDEGKDIIRWKLKKNFAFNINETHLDYQVLDQKDDGAVSILVSLTSKNVITQYEELFLQAELEPKVIDFASFNVYRLFSARMSVSENCIFLSFYSGIFSMLVFYGGILAFYRSKEIPHGVFEPSRVFREINNSQLVFKEKFPGFTAEEVFVFTNPEDSESFQHVVDEAVGMEPVMLDVSRVLSINNGLSSGRSDLQSLAAALGAAMRAC